MAVQLLGLWPKSVLKKVLLYRWLWQCVRKREREREGSVTEWRKGERDRDILSRSTEVNTGTLSPNAFLAAPPEAAWSAPLSASTVVLKMALFERPRLGTVAPSGRSSEAYGMGMSNGK